MFLYPAGTEKITGKEYRMELTDVSRETDVRKTCTVEMRKK